MTVDVEMQTLLRADELGIRLEIVRGLPLWEAQPVVRHQRAIDRIRSTIQPTAPDGRTRQRLRLCASG